MKFQNKGNVGSEFHMIGRQTASEASAAQIARAIRVSWP